VRNPRCTWNRLQFQYAQVSTRRSASLSSCRSFTSRCGGEGRDNLRRFPGVARKCCMQPLQRIVAKSMTYGGAIAGVAAGRESAPLGAGDARAVQRTARRRSDTRGREAKPGFSRVLCAGVLTGTLASVLTGTLRRRTHGYSGRRTHGYSGRRTHGYSAPALRHTR
jgi:hypothetical protein